MAFSSLWIAREVYEYRYFQMDMDEASHAVHGLDFTSAILDRNPAEVWHNLTKPHWYPPGNGILLGSWFLVFHSSTLTARLFSTLCYFLFGFLLYAFAREIIPEALPYFWLVPPLLLAAGALHVLSATQTMLEIPVSLYMFTSLFFFTRSIRTHRWLDTWLSAGFVLLTFFSRYDFGLVALGTLAASTAIFYRREIRKPFPELVRENFPLISCWIFIAIVLSAWLFGLGEWHWLAGYSGARPQDYTFWSLANFLYYPRLLLLTPVNFLPLLLLLVGIVIWILKRAFRTRLLPLVIAFALSFAMLTLVLYKIPRFGMILFPPLWVCAAAAAADIYMLFQFRSGRIVYASLLFATLLISVLFNHAALGSRMSAGYENPDTAVDQAYGFIADSLDIATPRDLKVLMRGRTDQRSSAALRFYLESRCLYVTPGCQISVLDDMDLDFGFPRREYSQSESILRVSLADQSANALVIFTDEQDVRHRGWDQFAESSFMFGDERLRVLVFRHQPTLGEEDGRVIELWRN